MPPYFFATTPEGANRIQGELGPERVRVYGPSDVTNWSLDAVNGIAAQNCESPLLARRVPAVRDLKEIGAGVVSSGEVLMMADVKDDYSLGVLANRTKVEISPV